MQIRFLRRKMKLEGCFSFIWSITCFTSHQEGIFQNKYMIKLCLAIYVLFHVIAKVFAKEILNWQVKTLQCPVAMLPQAGGDGHVPLSKQPVCKALRLMTNPTLTGPWVWALFPDSTCSNLEKTYLPRTKELAQREVLLTWTKSFMIAFKLTVFFGKFSFRVSKCQPV